jgi:hypothetical protein
VVSRAAVDILAAGKRRVKSIKKVVVLKKVCFFLQLAAARRNMG